MEKIKSDAGTPKIKDPIKGPQKKVPNTLSRLFFCWMFPIFHSGNKRDLEEYDLVPAKKIYDSKLVGDKLERVWHQEVAKAKAAGKKPSLVKALIKSFGWSYVTGGILQLLFNLLKAVTPLLFAELLTYWSVNSTIDQTTAAYYATAMIVANLLGAIFNHHGNLLCQQLGMKLRVATSSLMYRKIMRMNNASLGETTAGKVVNILSNDMQRFDLALTFMHYIWIIPIQLAIVCYLGYLQAGYAALIGLAALVIISLPIQGVLSYITGKVRQKTADKTDDRVKVMSEVINGIQVIKMYAWEIPFQKIVGEKRYAEMKQVRIATYLRIIFLGFLIFTERAALFVTVLTYILFGNSLTANVVYPLQQFMNVAQVNVALILPLVFAFTAELLVSIRRIEEFLSLEDRPDLRSPVNTPNSNLFRNVSKKFRRDSSGAIRAMSYYSKPDIVLNGHDDGKVNGSALHTRRKLSRSVSFPSEIAVELRDVSASWTGDPNMMALKNLDLRIRKGKMCAIIGPVGSGKSSILQLLLKELPAATGTVSIYGTISYACQEAWLFPSTVRENILFGLSYDLQKYKRVCRVCALEKDFQQFPFGDQTLVGERGVSLSGGQRARINLARAVYREADIYLLDDPLSAVDANVGRQLFEGCINGYMKGRTRILVTHQIHFLKAADYIVVMNQGGIENMGTFDELVNSGKEFAMMLNALQEGKDKDADSASLSGSVESKEGRKRLKSITLNEEENQEEFEEQKVVAEERASGNLRWEVVSGYFRAGGNWFLILFMLFMILLTATSAAAVDYWVSYWSNQMAVYEEELGGDDMDPGLDVQVGRYTTGEYLIIHGVLVLACILLTQLRMFPLTTLCVSASKNLHNRMFENMIRGIMRFFDTSSSGRILNRFTKDMGALDEILPRTLLDVLQIYSTLCAILILNAIALYFTLIPSAVLLVIFFFFVKVYLKTAQGVKRLEGTTKSPVFGMVSSSLNGIATIRACGAQERLVNDFDDFQDVHTSAWNSFLCGGVTFGLYLDAICVVYLAIIIFVFLYLDLGVLVPVGSVGLAVTQSSVLTAMLQHGARMLVEFLAQLTSVERVMEYTRIENEPNLFEGQIAVSPIWPAQGKIVFQNVNLRYAPNAAPVLKSLNLNIESGWKVGIVGRTGAGKSSLISAIFRFAYIDGVISIDDVDTALVSRQGLRSKISIIPQEPVLFSATIRYNLDPFDIYSDDEIWRALEQVDMKSAVPSLDFKVTEGGANFSIGQRQLMCLARAVLRSNKILIMDEATANVDPSTDNFIQQTIRRQFADCTVLTIAHRLNTIMDSDRVLVMSFGQAVEFDHPHILLSDQNSQFSSMVRETGDQNAVQLARIATEKYFASNLEEYGQKEKEI